MFHGEPDEANRSFPELKLSEGLVLLPFVALIVFCGIYPKPMIDRIQPSMNRVLDRIVQEVPNFVNPDAPDPATDAATTEEEGH